MRRIMACCAVLMLGVAPAWADQLTLTGNNILWDGKAPSPTFTIGIENTAATSDLLIAWSLGLEIVPDSKASGTLQFASGVAPANYLLQGDSAGITPISFPTSSIAPVGDNANSAGVPVPASGKNLYSLTFAPVADGTSGIFAIVVHADEFSGSYWNSTDFEPRSFIGAPLPDGSYILATVTITAVPEPATWIMAGQVLAAGTILVVWRRRSRRATPVGDAHLNDAPAGLNA